MSEAYRGPLTVTYPLSDRAEPPVPGHRPPGTALTFASASLLEAVPHPGLGDEVPGM